MNLEVFPSSALLRTALAVRICLAGVARWNLSIRQPSRWVLRGPSDLVARESLLKVDGDVLHGHELDTVVL
mgnify:CR=1 FL=1